jgi:signal transduction histidine kinase
MAMVAGVENMLEQFRHVLECQVACFVPGCPDEDLRHPLLDIAPGDLLPVLCSVAAPLRREEADSFWQEEPVLALCDLAMQSGKMLLLRDCEPAIGRWKLRSIAALPLESARGILGTCLLADRQPGRFTVGEERLLYACLSICLPEVEKSLGEEVKRVLTGSEGERGIKSEFVSMVGHELRTPLGIIKGYAGLLQAYGGTEGREDRALAPEQQKRYLQAIVEQAGLLEILVNDLLDIARLQRGELALRLGAVDLEALCHRVIELGRLRAEQIAPGNYRLECRLPARLPAVQADGERLQQVLLNLLDNAIKYSPGGGSIELEVREADSEGREMIIAIRDRGVGIPEHQLSALFQPFERLERQAIAHIAGVGLGLYIARRLIEAMGGKIEIESCEGCGTNVTIRLPTGGPKETRIPHVIVQGPVSSSSPENTPGASSL